MSLTMRMVAPVLGALRRDRDNAMRDPSILRLLVRERARLARMLAASAPRLPRMNNADLLVLRALAEVHEVPVEVVLGGVATPGSVVRSARIRFDDDERPVVDVGTARVDDWGRLNFVEIDRPLASPAPAPLEMVG